MNAVNIFQLAQNLAVSRATYYLEHLMLVGWNLTKTLLSPYIFL
jgi:hypothetical protein